MTQIACWRRPGHLGFPDAWDPYRRETMNVSDVYHYGTQHFSTTQAADALGRSNSPQMKTRFGPFGVSRIHGLGGLQDRWALPT